MGVFARVFAPGRLLAGVLAVSVLSACNSAYTRREYATETRLHGDYSVGGLQDGSYMYVKTGLTGSASAAPDSEDGRRLGALAMDELVRKAKLQRNQALVNVTVERGEAYRGQGSARRTLAIVTVRGDVIEFFSKQRPPGTALPDAAKGPGDTEELADWKGKETKPRRPFKVDRDTVEDPAAHLTWQRVASADKLSQDKAKAFCARLDIAGGGWRLPSRKELQSLVDEGATPALDPGAFPQEPAAIYWTATAQKNGDGSWAVDFSNGNTVDEDPAHKFLVRCVR